MMSYRNCLFLLNYFFIVTMALSVISGCTLGPEKREPPTVFDLGAQNTALAPAPVINATFPSNFLSIRSCSPETLSDEKNYSILV